MTNQTHKYTEEFSKEDLEYLNVLIENTGLDTVTLEQNTNSDPYSGIGLVSYVIKGSEQEVLDLIFLAGAELEFLDIGNIEEIE